MSTVLERRADLAWAGYQQQVYRTHESSFYIQLMLLQRLVWKDFWHLCGCHHDVKLGLNTGHERRS